jgi:hypothetical protein
MVRQSNPRSQDILSESQGDGNGARDISSETATVKILALKCQTFMMGNQSTRKYVVTINQCHAQLPKSL